MACSEESWALTSASFSCSSLFLLLSLCFTSIPGRESEHCRPPLTYSSCHRDCGREGMARERGRLAHHSQVRDREDKNTAVPVIERVGERFCHLWLGQVSPQRVDPVSVSLPLLWSVIQKGPYKEKTYCLKLQIYKLRMLYTKLRAVGVSEQLMQKLLIEFEGEGKLLHDLPDSIQKEEKRGRAISLRNQ